MPDVQQGVPLMCTPGIQDMISGWCIIIIFKCYLSESYGCPVRIHLEYRVQRTKVWIAWLHCAVCPQNCEKWREYGNMIAWIKCETVASKTIFPMLYEANSTMSSKSPLNIDIFPAVSLHTPAQMEAWFKNEPMRMFSVSQPAMNWQPIMRALNNGTQGKGWILSSCDVSFTSWRFTK